MGNRTATIHGSMKYLSSARLEAPSSSSSPSSWSAERQLLKTAYVLTCCLCLMMIFWILVFPGTWMLGIFKGRKDFILSVFHNSAMARFGTTAPEYHVIPPEVVATKYEGHPAVQLTHFLPAAIWSAAIPFQLHPGIRKNYRAWHRRIGYVFMSMTIPMMVGVILILMRGLLFENFFPDLPPSPGPSGQPFLVLLSIWFLTTALLAVVKARQRDFAAHERYMVRHVGSGLWVAVQRVLLSTIYNRPPLTRLEQRENFGHAAKIGIVISFVCAEWVVLLLNSEHQGKKRQSRKKRVA